MFLRRYILILMCLWAGLFQLAAGTTVIDSIISEGVYRRYRLYIPTIYSGATSVPMVVNLHGLGSNAYQQQYYGNFM
jgi:polyhydroxybutyrate depolymerase